MKAKKWYIKFPQDAYALGPVYFEEPVFKKDVRAYALRWFGSKKLPIGFDCWPVKQ